MPPNPNTPSSCGGTQASLPSQCACPDPGVVSSGGNVIVADANLCPRRLLPVRDGSGNIVGAVLADLGGGTPNSVIMLTNQPQVLYPLLSPAADQSFGSLVVASGANGAHYRLAPPATANLFLQTDGAGGLELAAPPTSSIPNPLDAVTLVVSGTTNLEGTVAIGGIITSNVQAGTIVSLLGLNSSNQFVQGNVAQVLKALFYEGTSYMDQSFLNASLLANTVCYIGNQIYSADGIATVGNSQTITISVNGTYEVDWSGCFGASSTAGGFSPGLQLLRNGTPIAEGQQGGVAGFQSAGPAYTGVGISGKWIGGLNATDTLQIKATAPSFTGALPSTSSPAAMNLRNVMVVLTKFH